MKKIFYFLIFLYTAVLFAQNNPYQDIQQFAKKSIAQHQVYQIIAWEYSNEEDTVIVDTSLIKPFQQSIETYDTLGRLVSTENFWHYSDEEPLKRVFIYDSLHRIVEYQEHQAGEILIKEAFTYDARNNMLTWSADLVKKRQKHFEETIQYDSLFFPVLISVKLGKKEVESQRIKNTYNEQSKRILELCFDDKNHLVDSTVYSYPQESDTLYTKKIYEGKHKELTFAQSFINRLDGTQLYRNEEYVENKFMGVTYYVFEAEKGIVKERSIHHFPQLNFTKTYHYDAQNIIKEKRIFKSTENPVSIIKYEIKYFNKD